MRTKEDIKLIAEEIHLNVQRELLREDRKKMAEKLKEYAYKHKDQLISPMGIAMMVSSIRCRETQLNRAMAYLKTEKAFRDYTQKVRERL